MIGLFTGSFDPIHPGHIDVIKRAAEQVSLLHVVVAQSSSKRYLINKELRVSLCEAALKNIPNVKISVSDLSIQEILFSYSPDIFFRGIRNDEDISYEMKMLELAKLGYSQRWVHKFIDTSPEYKNISSSLIKDDIFNANPFMDRNIFNFKHSPKGFLPFWWDICCFLITKSIRFSVIGPVASGKSTFIKSILDTSFLSKNNKNIAVSKISVDKISRDLFDYDYLSIIRDIDWCCSKLGCNRNYEDFNNARLARSDETDLINDIVETLSHHIVFAHQQYYKNNKGIIIHEWFAPTEIYQPFQGFKFLLMNTEEDVVIERLKTRPTHHLEIYRRQIEFVNYNELRKKALILKPEIGSIQKIIQTIESSLKLDSFCD